MESKYFGSIDEKTFKALDLKQQAEYLLDKELLHQIYSSSNLTQTDTLGVFLGEILISDENLEYEFTQELVKTVFDFLKKHYKNGIGGDLALFNRDFDVETFGLTPQEKRKRGLYYFKKYFELAIGDRQIGMKRNSDGEVVAEKRFKTLQASRMDHINQLRNINNIVLYYLFGSLNRFDVKFYESNQLIQSIFRFENYLSILISLNNKFKFEEEKYFTPKSIAQEIYENYEEHFDSVKQLDFIEQELKIGNNQKHGYVVSLYFYFKKELKSAFPSAVLFQKIINNDFYLNIGRIKLSDPQNENHVLRLKEIERKWKQFSQN
jgi:hypothetical protein